MIIKKCQLKRCKVFTLLQLKVLRQMRVLHLLKSNKYSGAENVVLTIMDACPDVEMIYASTDGPFGRWLKTEDIGFIRWKIHRFGW